MKHMVRHSFFYYFYHHPDAYPLQFLQPHPSSIRLFFKYGGNCFLDSFITPMISSFLCTIHDTINKKPIIKLDNVGNVSPRGNVWTTRWPRNCTIPSDPPIGEYLIQKGTQFPPSLPEYDKRVIVALQIWSKCLDTLLKHGLFH